MVESDEDSHDEEKDRKEIHEFTALTLYDKTTMVAYGYKFYPAVEKKKNKLQPKDRIFRLTLVEMSDDEEEHKSFVANTFLTFGIEGEGTIGKIKSDLKVVGDKCKLDITQIRTFSRSYRHPLLKKAQSVSA